MLSFTARLGQSHPTVSSYRRPSSTSLSVQRQANVCPGCSYCEVKTSSPTPSVTETAPSRPTTSSPAILSSVHPTPPTSVNALFRRISTALTALQGPETLRPLIFPNVPPLLWTEFTLRFATHPALTRGAKWEYTAARRTITVVALATPFHDIACSIMSIQHTRLFVAGTDTQRRFERLKVNRSRMSKQTPDGGRSDREPDCAVLAIDYHRAIPTIVWEVGHSQGLPALVKRAKMWCRRYDGNVRVVILVKYLRRNPRVDKTALLWVYRPVRRASDGRWTALQEGPVYTLFPAPLNAGEPEDAIPLTYEDYFGPGNVGEGVDAQMRCDLPLELVRGEIEEGIQTTLAQDGYRHVSGGSSVAGVGGVGGAVEDGGEEAMVEDAGEEALVEVEREEREESPEGEPYEEYGEDWDVAMGDESDA